MTGDTIAAIATAMSASGIGIIRISGDDSMEIISKVYRSKGGKKQIKEAESHTIHYGFIYDNDTLIDEVLVMIMKGPRSYTGEDTVEIDCHGGVLAMKKVLEAVIPYPPGIPLVNPGELVTEEIWEYMEEYRKKGLHFHGPSDASLDSFCVL